MTRSLNRPATVDLASYLLWLLVAAGLAVSILVLVLREELAETWAPQPTGDSALEPVDFAPVIVVLYVVVAVTALTLVPLFRTGHNWARHSLAALVIGVFVATVGTVRTTPPDTVLGCAIAAAVICAVTLVFLWHPDSRRFVREASAAELD